MTSAENVSVKYNIYEEYTIAETGSGALINDGLTIILKWIIYSILCQLMNVFGIVTNIINMICFIKQGFKDTINICLLGKVVVTACKHRLNVFVCKSVSL